MKKYLQDIAAVRQEKKAFHHLHLLCRFKGKLETFALVPLISWQQSDGQLSSIAVLLSESELIATSRPSLS